MENSKNMAAIIAVVVVLLVGLGIWLFAMNNDNDDQANNTAESSQTATDEAAMADEKDIVDTAAATESLSTLVTAVKAADLVETLKGDGPFTVFAPTNDAFDKLPEGTLDDLLKPENKDTLAGILTYHVVSGEVKSSDLSDGQVVKTVQGDELTVEIDGDKVYLVDTKGAKAMVTTADVMTSNGVVHIIDAVVMPKS